MENGAVMNDEIKLDKIGIFLSALCLIHCVASPIVIIMLPWLSSVVDSIYAHIFFFVFVFPTAIFAFYHGAKRHHDYIPFKLGLLGISLLIIGILNQAFQFLHTHTSGSSGSLVFGEILAHFPSILGSLILVLAHYRNLTNCRCSHHHH